MNYNIAAYMIYLAMMVYIIVYVGKYFFINGRIFIISLFKNDVALADKVNRILLVAYYLFNIGYALLRLNNWKRINSVEMLIADLSVNLGLLILILGLMHYMNMFIIYFLSKTKSNSITNKSFQL